MGPKQFHSTVSTREEEALIVAFRRHMLLPLDDCLYTLQATRPHLTQSSLHRCLQRHGISRLPDMAGEKPAKKRFKSYPIGYFHIDIAEVHTEEGKLSLFVAIDRACKFAYAELHAETNNMVAAQFLRNSMAAIPDKIQTVLTDNGIQFTNRKRDLYAFHHILDRACQEYGIDHRLTKTDHPWRNEHMAYCTSSPASWPLQGTDTLTATASWNGCWRDEHAGTPIMIARPRDPSMAIPAPDGRFAHA